MQGDKRHRVFGLFKQTDRAFNRSVGRKVMDTGIYRSQHMLLMMLGRFPESSQAELAEKMDISPAAVAVSLKKLEKAGFVSRQSKQQDNRTNQILITEKGKAAIDASVLSFREVETAFLKGFSTEELQILEGFFERITHNAEEYYHDLIEQDEKE